MRLTPWRGAPKKEKYGAWLETGSPGSAKSWYASREMRSAIL